MPKPKATEPAIRADRKAIADKQFDEALALPRDAGQRLELLKAAVRQLAEEDRLPRLHALQQAGALSGIELWHLLLENYFDINGPYLTCTDILPMFRVAFAANGLLRFKNEQIPTEPKILFRAAHPEGKRGISWSSSLEGAKKFLNDPEKKVYRVLAKPAHMLGVFQEIGEEEYFLDCDLIPDPQEVPSSEL